MGLKELIKKFASYFFDVHVKKYQSIYSGDLFIAIVNGKKVLNTGVVNYSYDSLHRVFTTAFKKSQLSAHHLNNILILGLGGGSIINILRKEYASKAPITVVEIDSVVIEIAEKEFNINQYDPLNIIQKDALNYINETSEKFDLICVDIFINELVPDQFLSIDFIQKLMNATNNNGFIYYNIMLSNASVHTKFNMLIDFLQTKKGNEIRNIVCYQIQENNRVLVVNK